MIKIAVLLTTFNRKEKTVTCLRTLKTQSTNGSIKLDLFVTDDASEDGTVQAIYEIYPQANVLIGSGSLFWAGGMRKSWTEAANGNYDFYLLLNDDTELLPDAIEKMLSYSDDILLKPAIIIGSTAFDGNISYGGKIITSRINFKKQNVFSETDFVECDLGNANIMLVPAQIVKEIGILNDNYTHGIADYCYTLTAQKAGYKIMVAPGILGLCTDDHGNSWKSSNVNLKQRIAYLKSPKGLSYKEYLYFIKTHLPIHYPIAFTKLWIKTFFPFLWDSFKNK